MMIMNLGVSCGAASLLADSTKPHTANSTMKEIKKLNQFLKENPLDKFGIVEGFMTVTVPSLLIDIAAKGPEEMQELAKLSRAVLFAGAPLPLDTGDLLAEHGVNLHSGFGM